MLDRLRRADRLEGSSGIDIYPVTDPAGSGGASSPDPVAAVEAGTSQDFEGQRQAAYAAMGHSGRCIGGLKAFESRNTFTFSAPSDAHDDCGAQFPDSPDQDENYNACVESAVTLTGR